ncbi:hypothetical protein AAFN88_18565 [Pelagibius sp. CAU 1746]|uniref:hypothetical protein n=1 Tax=Pelagibius sp. CAU 1746 TaxID=3140370 RepID=UPI00325BCF03
MKSKRKALVHNLVRAFLGYAVAAGIIILIVAAATGFAFGTVLRFGSVLAIVVGLVVVVPGCLVLLHFGQMRPWWAAKLGALALMLPSLVLLLQTIGRRQAPLAMGRDVTYADLQELAILGCIGAAAGLVGWVVAYGFRCAPKPPPEAGATQSGGPA